MLLMPKPTKKTRGVLSVFLIKGHPKANICYAWSLPIERSTERRYYTALHTPPADHLEKAVGACIVYDDRTGEKAIK
jgi:hypothetical protein